MAKLWKKWPLFSIFIKLKDDKNDNLMECFSFKGQFQFVPNNSLRNGWVPRSLPLPMFYWIVIAKLIDQSNQQVNQNENIVIYSMVKDPPLVLKVVRLMGKYLNVCELFS